MTDEKIPLIPTEDVKSKKDNIDNNNTDNNNNFNNYDSSKEYVTVICDDCLKEFQSEIQGEDISEREINLKIIKDKLKQGITHKEFLEKNPKLSKYAVDCQCNLRYHNDTIRVRKRIENEMKKESEHNEEEKKRQERYKELANDIINKGDAINFIIKTSGKFHYGDDNEILITYLSALTTKIKNSNGMHMNAVGDIGIGKSDIQRTVAHILPVDKVKSGDISPKALFYDEELTDGIIIFIDDTEISDDIAQLMRKATTRFHEKCEYKLVKDQKKLLLKAPAEIVWWINFNFATKDEALNNRFIVFNVDESVERKRKIHEFITQREKEGRPVFYIDDDVEICRMIFDVLPLCVVGLPFDTEKFYGIQHDISFRDRNIVMDMIKCYALINYKKRKTEKPGILTLIEANDDDFNMAKEMWNYLFNSDEKLEKKRDNLTKLERNIYKLLLENPEGYFVGDIALKLDKSMQNISRSLSNLKDKRSDVDCQDESVPIKDTDGNLIKTIHKRRYLITGINISYDTPIFSASEEEKNEADNIKDNKYKQRTVKDYMERISGKHDNAKDVF